MTIEELEDILATYKIYTPNIKASKVENASIPVMLTLFRKLIKDDVPPTQDEFITEFRENYPDLKSYGIISRLRRAYLSYIREYHLGFLLHKHFNKVVYSEKADILGVDYVVYHKRHKYNIHAFVDTESGRFWRNVKNGRHTFKGRHIDMPIDLRTGKRVGKIILYTEQHVEELKRQIENFSAQIENKTSKKVRL